MTPAKRTLALMSVVAAMAGGCASFDSSGNGTVYESINRDSVLVRFASSPPGALATVECVKPDSDPLKKVVVTPANLRLPVRATCTTRFELGGYEDEVATVDISAMAHPTVLKEPDCSDPGVWCTTDDSLRKQLGGSLVFGVSGLVARVFDPVRRGRGEVIAIMQPISKSEVEATAPPTVPDSGKP